MPAIKPALGSHACSDVGYSAGGKTTIPGPLAAAAIDKIRQMGVPAQ